MNTENKESIIAPSVCPVCSCNTAVAEMGVTMGVMSSEIVISYLCTTCGYTSNSNNINESVSLRKIESTLPDLIKASKYVDPKNNQVWYPSVINLIDKGIIFPDGTNELDWQWRAAKYIEIPESEQKMYPIKNEPGQFYKSKLDMENSKLFNRNNFVDACEFIGISIINSNTK